MRNIIHLTGHAGKDPEVKQFLNGGRIAIFTLATTEKWKNKDGEKKERTDWHNIVVGIPSLVDVCEKYVQKGMMVEVDGSIRYREYEKDEKKHYSEFSYGSYMRSFPLPTPVTDEKVAASYENGILTVTMAKATPAGARQITIK